jgi:hypothetical protein
MFTTDGRARSTAWTIAVRRNVDAVAEPCIQHVEESRATTTAASRAMG